VLQWLEIMHGSPQLARVRSALPYLGVEMAFLAEKPDGDLTAGRGDGQRRAPTIDFTRPQRPRVALAGYLRSVSGRDLGLRVVP